MGKRWYMDTEFAEDGSTIKLIRWCVGKEVVREKAPDIWKAVERWVE